MPQAILSGSFSKVMSLSLALIMFISALIFDTPTYPDGERLDMSKFTLTWSDEFNYDEFDKTTWSGHYVWGYDATYPRDITYWNRRQASFRDGNLVLTVEYLENGPSEPEGPDGPAYFAYGMDTHPGTEPGKVGFEQLYGYFEIRCILPRGDGVEQAFWMLCDGMFNDDPEVGLTDGGVTGCEIDIFETNYDSRHPYKNSVFHTIHVDSYDEYHRMEVQGSFYANNPYDEYNTYGVEWNKNEYIFYINGVETARTNFGGVCQVPLYLIISCGANEKIFENDDYLPAEFIVDYVRAYQYTDLLTAQ